MLEGDFAAMPLPNPMVISIYSSLHLLIWVKCGVKEKRVLFQAEVRMLGACVAAVKVPSLLSFGGSGAG